ncbi:hypothetical protein AHAS_Ahas11G0237100 [Arachis hypogaea]
MNAHDDAINAVAVSNDGRVYTGSADKRIKVWKKKKGGGQGVVGEKSKSKNKHYLMDTLEKHKSGINALALNGDVVQRTKRFVFGGVLAGESIVVWWFWKGIAA